MTKYIYDHPRPALSVDIVILRSAANNLEVLLIQRARPPFENHWALPGGFVEIDEDIDFAAHRELAEETGLRDIKLEQLQAYGNPDRDPRGRVVTIAYYALIPSGVKLHQKAGSDAAQAGWFPIDQLPLLAFDHHEIIANALSSLD